MLTHEQTLIVRRFERLVGAARSAGLLVVVDATGSGAIRLIPLADAGDLSDLRDLGEPVAVDDALDDRLPKW